MTTPDHLWLGAIDDEWEPAVWFEPDEGGTEYVRRDPAAPTIAQQFPNMDDNDAYHFQQDAVTLSRLKIRGVITEKEHQAAIQRLAKAIWKAAGK